MRGTVPRVDTGFALPAGTVTFLLTDIEGSTRLWESAPEAMAEAVHVHDAVLAEEVSRHGGVRPVEQGEGDSLVAAFSRASDAVAAALAAQRRLLAQEWPGGIDLRVRIALHTAEAQLRDEGNYFGVALSRCARLRAVAHGGQTLLSRATRDLVVDNLGGGVELVDLGVHRLRDLGRPEHVFALAHPDLPRDTLPVASLDALPNNLPGQLSSFVGREEELAQVRQALGRTRLLTLTGTGGCGKTRLALQTAADLLDRFPDGAWWVELAPVGSAEGVGQALADAVGVRPLPGSTARDAALAHLAPRTAMVVLDNCEHLLEACAELAEALLESCPDVVVLATSRASLRVDGETQWRVPSLALPPAHATQPVDALTQYDAVRLFIERATKVRPNFRVSDDNAPAIAQVCHALDGIPLAIELAAARVRMLTVPQIAQALTDRFHLLTGGSRSALPRQQTLRASVEWSHELLDDHERILFRRLGAFGGSFGLDAVELVCAGDGLDAYAILDLLSALVDKSLVTAEEHGEVVRYRLLETVREFAIDHLNAAGESDALRDRHCRAFVDIAERIAADLVGPRQSRALSALDAEAANLELALDRAAATDGVAALRLCDALTVWWKLRGQFAAAESAYARALDAGGDADVRLRARVMAGRAYLLSYAGEYEKAAEVAVESLDLAESCGDASTTARALDMLGTLQIFHDPVGARPLLQRSQQLARESGDDWCFADCTQILGYSYLFTDDYEQMRTTMDEALTVIERTGQGEFISWHWFAPAYEHFARGEMAEARRLYERALASAEEVGEPVTRGTSSAWLAAIDLEHGEVDAALARLLAAREQVVVSGAGMALPSVEALLGAAELARSGGAAGRAQLESALPFTEGQLTLRALTLYFLALAALDTGDLEAAMRTAGDAAECAAALPSPYLVAMADHARGLVLAAQGAWTAAEEALHRSLAMRVERGFRVGIAESLEALAMLAGDRESPEEAARLLGAAVALREQLGVKPTPIFATRLDSLRARLQGELGEEAYQAAHAAGAAVPAADFLTWVQRMRGQRGRPSTGWDSLTPTEVRIARLAARGLTNPEIAAQAFVTRGTVKVHLSHVFTKLGLKNRAELAAEVARRGEAAGSG